MKKINLLDKLEKDNLMNIAKEYTINGFDIIEAYKLFVSKVAYKNLETIRKRTKELMKDKVFINMIENNKMNVSDLYKETTIKSLSKLREIVLNDYYIKYDVIKDTKTLDSLEITHKQSYSVTDKLKAIDKLLEISKLIKYEEDEKSVEDTGFNLIIKSINKE